MPKVVTTITVDWEGEKLIPADLKAMKVLNTKLELFASKIGQAIPITHFICPSYLTRTDDESERNRIARTILDSGAIKKEDEVGAHVHCWSSLALEAGIAETDMYKTPIGINPNSEPPVFRGGKFLRNDFGYTVPFGIYGKVEVTKFLNTTVVLLQKYLGANPVSFRCGMWVTCDVIFEAMAQTQLTNEASGIPFNYMSGPVKTFFDSLPGLRDLNMILWNVKIWGNAQTVGTDPQYVQNTKSFPLYKQGILGMGDPEISPPEMVSSIVEVPDTGALIPITNQKLMNAHIDSAFDIAEKTGEDVYISLGFHQEDCGAGAFFQTATDRLTPEETAVRLNGLLGSIAHIISMAQRSHFPFEFIKKTDLAAVLAQKKKFRIPLA
jgi:hypothetical protein